MSSVSNKMTVEEFEAYAAKHGRCELIHGEVRDLTPTGSDHGRITSRLNIFVGTHVLQNRLGETYAAETGFRLDDELGPVVRAPDLAFIERKRLPPPDTTTFDTTVPDLVIETVSPGDSASRVREKTAWWLSKGVKEAWVADPANKTITLHWPNGDAHTFSADQTLASSRVLPKLELELSQIFMT